MAVTLELPVLPVAHARVLSILGQQVASISEIVVVVESDPALTAAVLRCANSAASSPLSRIDTANNAIIRIGLSMTRRILTGAVINETFRGIQHSGVDVDELWRHLLMTALLSEGATADAGVRTAAFTAGLLHDIGRLAMASSAPDDYRRVLELVAAGSATADSERIVFGFDHTEWGVEVGRAWEFPDDVVEAIAHHHDGGFSLAQRTVDAREIAWRLGTGDGIVRPDGPALETSDRELALLESLGGRAGLEKRVETYRGAILVG
ncbi:MAG: HDOD domain-containing protein [Dehalococcoidia bacterium]